MARTFRLFGRELVTFPVCYGLPTVFGFLLTAGIWFVMWSYYANPVRFTKIAVDQVGNDGNYITLRITKYVIWSRLCSGYAEQVIEPVVSADNPKKVSAAPIKLDSHVINTPKRLGPNGQPGDPPPERFVVLSAGSIAKGMWRYTITAKMACLPWEYLVPIESHTATTDFEVK